MSRGWSREWGLMIISREVKFQPFYSEAAHFPHTLLVPTFQTQIPNIKLIFSYNLLPGGKSFFPIRVAVQGSGQSPILGHGPEVWSESPWF